MNAKRWYRLGIISLGSLFVSCSHKSNPEVSFARRMYPDMPFRAELEVIEKCKPEIASSSPTMNRELVKILMEKWNFLAGVASTMPRDEDEVAWDVLNSALQYYDSKDAIDVWMSCLDAAKPFAAVGTTPRDILLGSLVTMQELDIRPAKKQSLHRFTSLYTSFRQDEHLNHLEALKMIIDRRKFAN